MEAQIRMRGGEIAPTLNERTASCWSAAKRHQANIEYEF